MSQKIAENVVGANRFIIQPLVNIYIKNESVQAHENTGSSKDLSYGLIWVRSQLLNLTSGKCKLSHGQGWSVQGKKLETSRPSVEMKPSINPYSGNRSSNFHNHGERNRLTPHKSILVPVFSLSTSHEQQKNTLFKGAGRGRAKESERFSS